MAEPRFIKVDQGNDEYDYINLDEIIRCRWESSVPKLTVFGNTETWTFWGPTAEELAIKLDKLIDK